MTEKLNKIIVKIIEKKKGIKLTEIVKYLEGKTEEIEGLGEVTFGTVKSAVTTLFANGLIDLIEYKLPGEGEKNRIFAIPKNSVVTYTEQSVEAEFTPPEPVVETKVVFPADLFAGYVVIGDNSAEFLETAPAAQAYFLEKTTQDDSPRLYGAVPIRLEVTALLDTVERAMPIQVEETTTITFPTASNDQIGGPVEGDAAPVPGI